MKKIALVLAGALLLSLFAGCSGGGESMGADQILSVRNRKNGKILTIGDTQETVDKVTGGKERSMADFEFDKVHRADYYNAEGLFVDTFEDQVVGLRISSPNEGEDNWEIWNGVKLGMEKDKVLELYAGESHREEGLEGGVLLSYDKDRKPIPFDQESYYLITISFKDDRVDYVGIHTRIAEQTLKDRGEFVEDEGGEDPDQPAQSESPMA